MKIIPRNRKAVHSWLSSGAIITGIIILSFLLGSENSFSTKTMAKKKIFFMKPILGNDRRHRVLVAIHFFIDLAC